MTTEDTLVVTKMSALGRRTSFRVEFGDDGSIRRRNTNPSGLVGETVLGLDETVTSTLPDGTGQTLRRGSDPRLGMQAPILDSLAIVTPGGLTSVVKATRNVSSTDPGDPLSLVSQLDSIVVNGRVYENAVK